MKIINSEIEFPENGHFLVYNWGRGHSKLMYIFKIQNGFIECAYYISTNYVYSGIFYMRYDVPFHSYRFAIFLKQFFNDRINSVYYLLDESEFERHVVMERL